MQEPPPVARFAGRVRRVAHTANDRVLIVGGGIVGLTIAHAALRRGLAVEILDAAPDRRSTSRGNAGQIAPGHPPIPSPAVPPRALHMLLDPRSPLSIPPRPSFSLLRWLLAFRKACKPASYEASMQTLGSLGRLSREHFDELIEDLGAASLHTTAGVADIWRTEVGEADAAVESAWMERLGFATESLSGRALRSRDPAWGPDVRGAVIHTEGFCLDPAELCDALRNRIKALGGRMRHGCVLELNRTDSLWHATLHGGQVARGTRLVISAGIWSPPLARMLGLHIDMQPAKGYHVAVNMNCPPVIAGVLRESKIAVTPMGGLTRIAGTLELSGVNFRMVPHRLAQLALGAAAFLPELTGTPTCSPWCGLRPCTADGLPIIGPIGPKAWIATGHGMMGVTLATGTAELVMQQMFGDPSPAWGLSLRPKIRHARGR